MSRIRSNLSVSDSPVLRPPKSPKIAIIALRFVILLAAIVTMFAWAWSR